MVEPDQDHPIDVFEQQLLNAWPLSIWSPVSILVTVSGGPDSVALLRALHSLKEFGALTPAETIRGDQQAPRVAGRFEVAHFNHRWRIPESDEDEVFVSSLCDELGIFCHVGRSDRSEQKEELARNERYEFWRNVAEQRGARYIVTAHSANDQAETILHRIIRGTSLKGLRGISRSRQLSEAVTVVRPMLWATRDEINSCRMRFLVKRRSVLLSSIRNVWPSRFKYEVISSRVAHSMGRTTVTASLSCRERLMPRSPFRLVPRMMRCRIVSAWSFAE